MSLIKKSMDLTLLGGVITVLGFALTFVGTLRDRNKADKDQQALRDQLTKQHEESSRMVKGYGYGIFNLVKGNTDDEFVGLLDNSENEYDIVSIKMVITNISGVRATCDIQRKDDLVLVNRTCWFSYSTSHEINRVAARSSTYIKPPFKLKGIFGTAVTFEVRYISSSANQLHQYYILLRNGEGKVAYRIWDYVGGTDDGPQFELIKTENNGMNVDWNGLFTLSVPYRRFI